MQFWQDTDKKRLNPELFSGVAEEKARLVATVSSDKTNAPTQLRKFYDEIVSLAGTIKARPEEFDNLLPYIKMLNAKAAYAQARNTGGSPLISSEFKQLLKEAVDQVKEPRDVDVFLSFFEAFMGFYKFHYEEKKKAAKQGGRR